MGFIDKLFFNRSKSFYDNKQYYYNEQIGNNTPTYVDMQNLDIVYHENTHVKTVINNDADMVSNLKWQLLDSNDKVIESDPLLDLLYNPNPLQSGKDFIFNLVVNEDIFGNAFVYKNQVFGTPRALWVVPSKGVEVKKTGKLFKQTELNQIISGYKFEIGSYTENFETEDIILFRQNDSNLILADSKLKALKPQISNIKSAYDSRNVLLTERGAIGILSYEGGDSLIGFSPNEKKLAEEKLIKSYGIKEGQRRINISTIPVKYQPMSFPTKDLMLFEEVADDFNCILDAFGQNINIYSREKGATFTNYKESLKGIYQNTIIPKAERIANTLTNSLITDGSGKRLVPVFDVEALQEDDKQRNEAFKVKVDALNSLLDRQIISESDIKNILEL